MRHNMPLVSQRQSASPIAAELLSRNPNPTSRKSPHVTTNLIHAPLCTALHPGARWRRSRRRDVRCDLRLRRSERRRGQAARRRQRRRQRSTERPRGDERSLRDVPRSRRRDRQAFRRVRHVPARRRARGWRVRPDQRVPSLQQPEQHVLERHRSSRPGALRGLR